jgi:deoxyribonuclease-4
MPKLFIGRHIGTFHFNGPELPNIYEIANEFKMNTIQIFLKSPNMLTFSKQNPEILKGTGKILKKNNIKIIIHGSYIINFCHPKNSLMYKRSVKNLVDDLLDSHLLQAEGVIIHMGKNIPKNNLSDIDAMRNYVNGLKEVLAKTPSDTKIILETGASQGNEIGSKIIDLSKIYHALTTEEKKRIGFCIDTCHIWVSGYDISSEIKVKKFMKIFNKYIGLDKITLFHFNNSSKELGSRADRHADLSTGVINKSGLKIIAKWAYINEVPLIMETPLETLTVEKELSKVKKWTIKGI